VEIQQKPTWKLTRAQGMPGAESSNTCWKSMRSSDNSPCISDAPLPGPSTPPLSDALPGSLPPAPLMAPLGELGLSAALLGVSPHLEPVILVCDGSGLTTSPACACAAVDGIAAGCASALDPGRSTRCVAPALQCMCQKRAVCHDYRQQVYRTELHLTACDRQSWSFQSRDVYFNSDMSSLHWKSKPRNVWGQCQHFYTVEMF